MITFSNLGKYGRLGNQLFQYAALKGLSIKKGYEIGMSPDIFSSDDIGLLKAMGKNYFNNIRPTKDDAENFSLKWKPWRTIASWYLWRSIDPEVVLY